MASEYGEMWKERRERGKEQFRKHGSYCDDCGSRVYDYEEKCFRCGTKNHYYKPKKDGN